MEQQLNQCNQKITEMEKTIAHLENELEKQKMAFNKFVKEYHESYKSPIICGLINTSYELDSQVKAPINYKCGAI